MKTVLAVAAILGFSASAAFADCAWHTSASAANDVDTTITTASIVHTTQKQSRLPAATDPLILKDRQDAQPPE